MLNWLFYVNNEPYNVSIPLLIYPQSGVTITTNWTWLNYSSGSTDGKVLTYHVYNSTDGVNFAELNYSTLNYYNFSYANVGQYWWKVRACLDTNNCTLFSDPSNFYYTTNITDNTINAENAVIYVEDDFLANTPKYYIVLFALNDTNYPEYNYQNFSTAIYNKNISVKEETKLRFRSGEVSKR